MMITNDSALQVRVLRARRCAAAEPRRLPPPAADHAGPQEYMKRVLMQLKEWLMGHMVQKLVLVISRCGRYYCRSYCRRSRRRRRRC